MYHEDHDHEISAGVRSNTNRIIQGQLYTGLPKSNQTGNIRRSDKDSIGTRTSERNHGIIKLFGL